jgi:hypothetical protein
LDEIFGKKQVDVNGVERSTKVFRKTRVTQVPIKEEEEDEREGTNASVNAEEYAKGVNPKSAQLEPYDEDEDVVVLPTKVTRS